MWLNIGYQRLDQDRFFGFFRGDAMPCYVLYVIGVPIELHGLHGKYMVKESQGCRDAWLDPERRSGRVPYLAGLPALSRLASEREPIRKEGLNFRNDFCRSPRWRR